MIKTVGRTDIGRVRENNEDRFIIVENKLGHKLLAVADGMGGHNAGEVASKIVCVLLENSFRQIDKKIDYRKYIKDVIAMANEKIYTNSLFREEYQNMGTTISLIIIAEAKAYTGHVGDSRIYYKSANEIVQITKDHTLTQMLIDNGTLKAENKDQSNYSNILIQALGTTRNLTIEIKELKLPKGYCFLICSDGLTEVSSDQAIKQYLDLDADIIEKADQLLDYSLKQEGKDNITFIIVEQGDE
ncbi:MAG: Stp1/IreP family PP2C-type Ser/Thr phosphatase [Mycoplasmatales bacterium]